MGLHFGIHCAFLSLAAPLIMCTSCQPPPVLSPHPSVYIVYIYLQVVSSAIVDKYIGESARLIREMFGYARDHQPCIIFMDEIDAIGRHVLPWQGFSG